ncbi:MAG: hypothetical protein SFX72_14800 [Isosphaeraceae bacterium]|nr:hypothetical protein [Isosphaeraceae bacterium]
MQGWSRMAALTILAVRLCSADSALSPARAQTTSPSNSTPAAPPRTETVGKVTLTLVITGLAGGETEVEIRPGNGACTFPTQVAKVKSTGESFVRVVVKDLEIRSTTSSRDCSLAISIREPGKPERFTRRGFRLAADASTAGQSMTYYLNPTALAVRDSGTPRKVK